MTSSNQRVRDNDRRSQATPFGMGAGHLDPGRVNSRGSAFEPGLVYDAGLLEYAAFTCGADAGIFTAASCDFLESQGLPFDGSDLNVPSIGIGELAGTQTVTRTVTSVASRTTTFRARVDEPRGYDVKVSPRVIRLAPGESATFEVTITNTGRGPIGDWRFGSLAWQGGGYDVHSPIAVRAAPFSAPPLVTGTGTDGSASFDVAFGYDGAYTAEPHGLAENVVISDTVVQDPDQTFDPNDGFSNAHEFDLTGAAYFRLALPPGSTEADADLDVFVADPSGAIVAQSTAGGTDELIDIALPAPGTWTVYVHGWQTIGPDSDYDMSTWTVPGTPGGGSLSVTSAPPTAVLATTGTVDIAWTGLTAGQTYLGAVSHNDDTSILGFTLVEVTS
jgi:hypothetical protein